MAGVESKLTYNSYLKIPQLLVCQEPITDVHDEHVFIIVHQAFELWFKMIIHDITSVRDIFYNAKDGENLPLHTAINRLQRVAMVLRLVVEHFHILETMPPLNFVDFRDKVTGGSGFQSLQFRQIEKLLGMNDEHRQKYGQDYKDKMDPKDKKILKEYPDRGTLLEVVQTWLESTSGIDDQDFWEKYRDKFVKKEDLDPLLDQSTYKKGCWQMRQRSLKGAILIMLHQDKAEFQMSYQFLTLLMDIDVALMKWRSTHIHMVHRMIGQQQVTGGTQGTSGYDYLRTTYSDDYKVFRDLFKMATYLRPRTEIPELKTEPKSPKDN